MGSSRGDAAQRLEPKWSIFTVTAYRCLNIYKYKYIYTLFSHNRCFEIDLYWWGFLRADIYWRIYWICRFNPLYCPLYLIKCVNCSHPIFFLVLKLKYLCHFQIFVKLPMWMIFLCQIDATLKLQESIFIAAYHSTQMIWPPLFVSSEFKDFVWKMELSVSDLIETLNSSPALTHTPGSMLTHAIRSPFPFPHLWVCKRAHWCQDSCFTLWLLPSAPHPFVTATQKCQDMRIQ